MQSASIRDVIDAGEEALVSIFSGKTCSGYLGISVQDSLLAIAEVMSKHLKNR